MQEGDVAETCANVSHLDNALNYKPHTSVNTGVAKFISWYKAFYKVEKRQPVSQKEVLEKVKMS
jgi:UDP-glucuronate 4-epimerase